MRITDIKAEKFPLKLLKPFQVAIGLITEIDTVIIRVDTDEGISGFGEGAGISFVTGETSDTIMMTLEALKPQLIGQNPFSIDHIHKLMDYAFVRNPSPKAAIDIALYDIMAKAAEQPLYAYLGGVKRTIETDLTIGIARPEIMAEEGKAIVARGFKHLKVKGGLDLEDDIEAIRLIRQAVGPDIHIKVDANQGYNVIECLEFMRRVRDYGVSFVEQPTPYWDVDGLARIRNLGALPVMADESLMQVQDAVRLIKQDAVDMMNIKLMKCGGLYRGLQINAIAEAANLPTMLGCMLESPVSIMAAAHMMSACPNIAYADLDSFMSFNQNDRIKSSFTMSGGVIDLGDAYGHGVTVDL